MNPGPFAEARCDASAHQPSLEKQDDVLGSELSLISAQPDVDRLLKIGDLYRYFPDASRCGVLARVICECGDGAILLMEEHDLGLIKSEKNTCDLLGKRKDQERSASKVNRQMEPLNQQRKPE
jgi:hypothetical protein